MLWPFKFLESFCCWILSFWIYHGPQSCTQNKSYGRLYLPRAFLFKFKSLDIWRAITIHRVKSHGRLNMPYASMFSFEHLDILLAWIGHPSQKLWPFESFENFLVQIWASRYIIGLKRTSKSKFIAVWIWLALPCLISSISIYFGPEYDIRVKCYGNLNFLRASVDQFRVSQYIMGLNHTLESKVIAVWIFWPCSNMNLSI